jgi:hypothetical protein
MAVRPFVYDPWSELGAPDDENAPDLMFAGTAQQAKEYLKTRCKNAVVSPLLAEFIAFSGMIEFGSLLVVFLCHLTLCTMT